MARLGREFLRPVVLAIIANLLTLALVALLQWIPSVALPRPVAWAAGLGVLGATGALLLFRAFVYQPLRDINKRVAVRAMLAATVIVSGSVTGIIYDTFRGVVLKDQIVRSAREGLSFQIAQRFMRGVASKAVPVILSDRVQVQKDDFFLDKLVITCYVRENQAVVEHHLSVDSVRAGVERPYVLKFLTCSNSTEDLPDSNAKVLYGCRCKGGAQRSCRKTVVPSEGSTPDMRFRIVSAFLDVGCNKGFDVVWRVRWPQAVPWNPDCFLVDLGQYPNVRGDIRLRFVSDVRTKPELFLARELVGGRIEYLQANDPRKDRWAGDDLTEAEKRDGYRHAQVLRVDDSERLEFLEVEFVRLDYSVNLDETGAPTPQ